MKRFAAIYLVFSISMLGMAQTLPAPAEPTTVSAPPSKNALVDGTPIRLTLSENISSANAIVGQDVPFTVVDDVVVNGYVVISHGAPAKGTVTEAQPKRRMGRGGKLNINIDSVRLNDNEKVALRAVKDAKGGGHTGAMTTGIVLTALVFWPVAPLFLFMHGKDITIPRGTEITTFVNGTVSLDPAKFAAPAAGNPVNPVVSATPAGEKISITSTPIGADVSADGSFVGNTPSQITLLDGPHTITVEKTGYQTWSRKFVVAGNPVNLDAAMVSSK